MRKLICVGDGKIILCKEHGNYRLPSENEIILNSHADTFTFSDYIATYIGDAGLDITRTSAEIESQGLRESWGMLPEIDFAAAAKGAELINWNRAERFCCRCGSRLERASEISKRCTQCSAEYFPRLNPAIVVLVKKGEEALLVHARTLRPDVMALVAGFVETGESLEQCVRREVMEETSLEIDNIKYYGSQAWPFPYQLMVGFTATYAGGELCFSDGELTAGGFFTRDNPPVLPTKPSLTRRIIDAWIRGEI